MKTKDVADYLIQNRRQTRTSKRVKCPVCGHADGHCLAMEDGSAALCPKAGSTGGVKQYGQYGWLYILSGSQPIELPAVRAPRAREKTDAEMDKAWRPRVVRWQQGAAHEVWRLASVLGVASRALGELGVGWDGKAWTFPEKNGKGLVVGVNRRFEDGSKRCATGSRRGLTYSDKWASYQGPVLLVEGGSDVAAGITLGLATVGRPSNVGGVEMLRVLLCGSDRNVVVIGERDRKEDGRWPGMDGAKSVSVGLATRLQRSVCCRLLPGGAKDLRAWLRAQKLTVADLAACYEAGRELVKGW